MSMDTDSKRLRIKKNMLRLARGGTIRTGTKRERRWNRWWHELCRTEKCWEKG